MAEAWILEPFKNYEDHKETENIYFIHLIA